MKYGDLPFVRVCYSDAFQTNDWDKPFPFEQAQTITKPTADNLSKHFGNKLPKTFKIYDNHPLRYVVYKNSLWVQFHAFDEDFARSFTPRCSENTKNILKKLDLPMLKKIFAGAKGQDFLTPAYFNAILEHRDQVLKHIR